MSSETSDGEGAVAARAAADVAEGAMAAAFAVVAVRRAMVGG